MRATVRMELRSAEGELVEVRQARNSVMTGGAVLIANLFSGKATGGITHMGIGINGEAETGDFSATELTTVGDHPDALTGEKETAVTPGDFTVRTDTVRRLVSVTLHATLPNAAAIGTLREAGLLSRTGETSILYNRVTFAPIQKAGDHELTMFWEVTFPYGDLNWM
jgi:hypothetical protein